MGFEEVMLGTNGTVASVGTAGKELAESERIFWNLATGENGFWTTWRTVGSGGAPTGLIFTLLATSFRLSSAVRGVELIRLRL